MLLDCQLHPQEFEFMNLTACNLMDLVLDEEVNERYKSTKKGPRKIFPIFNSLAVAWA